MEKQTYEHKGVTLKAIPKLKALDYGTTKEKK